MSRLRSVFPPASFRTKLRHTYASEMVRAGVSLPALMTLLGHVKTEMTMKYVLVSGDDLHAVGVVSKLLIAGDGANKCQRGAKG
jgi:Phage integrase family